TVLRIAILIAGSKPVFCHIREQLRPILVGQGARLKAPAVARLAGAEGYVESRQAPKLLRQIVVDDKSDRDPSDGRWGQNRQHDELIEVPANQHHRRSPL